MEENELFEQLELKFLNWNIVIKFLLTITIKIKVQIEFHWPPPSQFFKNCPAFISCSLIFPTFMSFRALQVNE